MRLRARGISLALHADLGNDAAPTRYLPLMEEVLCLYPENVIVWVHMGLSRELTAMAAAQHMLARQLENRPHGRSLLGGRDRRTRGRRQVFVKAGTGGRHDSTTASIEPHSGMNSRWRVTGVPHRRTTATPQHSGAFHGRHQRNLWSRVSATGEGRRGWCAAEPCLALALAVEAGGAGKTAIVLDTDPQASACRWRDRRQVRDPVVIDVQPSRLQNALGAAAEQGVDLVVIVQRIPCECSTCNSRHGSPAFP